MNLIKQIKRDIKKAKKVLKKTFGFSDEMIKVITSADIWREGVIFFNTSLTEPLMEQELGGVLNPRLQKEVPLISDFDVCISTPPRPSLNNPKTKETK